MVLCFDIGNTDIDVGVFEFDKLSKIFRINYEKGRQSWEYVQPIKEAFEKNKVDAKKVEDCVICSVVHSTTHGVYIALNEIFGFNPILFSNDEVANVKVRIGNPQEVGSDIVAVCLEVREKYKLPAIVIDMGTATTITAMDKNGALLGVSIITGVVTSLTALRDKTGLPIDTNLKAPKKAIGTDTAQSIASGAVLGSVFMMDGMIDAFKKEMGCDAYVYATGGISKAIIPMCKNNSLIDDSLLLKGLYTYYKMLKKGK
jgi:type III pantothenate kinase